MPKEAVYDLTQPHSVEVSWGREGGYVQVGSRFRDQYFRFIPADEASGEFVSNAEPERFDSLHVTLTERGQVNDLIRLLRRARDQAFGTDA